MNLFAAADRLGSWGRVYLGVIGSLMLVMGLVLLYRRVALFVRGVRTEGVFLDWEARGLRRIYYYPKVGYVAADGETYVTHTGAGSSVKKERRRYTVIYPHDAPSKGHLYSFLDYWAAPLAFFVLAAGAGVAFFQQ